MADKFQSTILAQTNDTLEIRKADIDLLDKINTLNADLIKYIDQKVSGAPITNVVSGIYDAGSKAEGSWIRFTSGTMFCWGSIPAVTTSNGGPWGTSPYNGEVTITLPQPYVDNTYSISGTPGQGSYPFISYPRENVKTASSFALYVFNNVPSLVNAGKWMTVGNWAITAGITQPGYAPIAIPTTNSNNDYLLSKPITYGPSIADAIARQGIFRYYTSDTAATQQYIHMKTNIPVTTLGSPFMGCFHFRGYSYGEVKTIDAMLCTYVYPPTPAILNTCSSGTHTCSSYKSADNYLVIVFGPVTSTYYMGFIIDQINSGPQGLTYSVVISASTHTGSATGAY